MEWLPVCAWRELGAAAWRELARHARSPATHAAALVGYAALLYAALHLALKTAAIVSRVTRRLLHGRDTPADALTVYPPAALEEHELAALAASASSRSRPRSGTESRESAVDDGVHPPLRPPAAAGDPSAAAAQPQLRRAHSTSALADLYVSTAPPSPHAGDADADRRVAEVVRMLRLLRHSVQGLDLAAALQLFPRIARVEVAAGGTLFTEGDRADSMYIVLGGTLSLSRGCGCGSGGAGGGGGSGGGCSCGCRVQLCTLGKGDVLDEYAIISGYHHHHHHHQAHIRPGGRADSSHGSSDVAAAGDATAATAASPAPPRASQPPSVAAGVAARAGTVTALTHSNLLRLDEAVITWFAAHHGASLVSFLLATTSRQWRIAHFTLFHFLQMEGDQREAALEPSTPALRLVDGGPPGGDSAAAPTPTTTTTTAPPAALAASSPEGGSSASSSGGESPVAAAGGVGGSASLRPSPPPPLTLSTRALLAAADAVVTLERGDTLFHAGDVADCVYVVVSGIALATCVSPAQPPQVAAEAVAAHRHHHHQHGLPPLAVGGSVAAAATAQHARTMTPGCVLGGLACFAELPHADSVVAVTALRLARFARQSFPELRPPCDTDDGTPTTTTTTDHFDQPHHHFHPPAAVPASLSSTSGRSRALSAAATAHDAATVPRDAVLVALARAVGRHQAPLLQRFSALGLTRAWLRAGDALFRAGERQNGLYLVISGRLRTYSTGASQQPSSSPPPSSSACAASSPLPPRLQLHPAAASGASTGSAYVAGGRHGGGRNLFASPLAAAGAAAALDSCGGGDTSASSTVDELHSFVTQHGVRVDVGRGETVGELAVLTSESVRLSSALCIRDCELVHVSSSAFEQLAGQQPSVLAQLARVVAARYRTLTESLSSGTAVAASLPSLRAPNAPFAVGAAAAGGSGAGSGAMEAVLQRALQRSVETSLQLAPPAAAAAVDGLAAACTATAAVVTPPPQLAAVSPLPTVVRSPFATIAVVPAGAQPPCIRDFTRGLVAALASTGGCAVLHLTSASVDEQWGEGTAASLDESVVRARVSAWLSAQEERHRFVVFEADEDPDQLRYPPPPPAPGGGGGCGDTGGSGGEWPPAQPLGGRRAGTVGGALASRARSFGRGLNKLLTSTLDPSSLGPGPLLRRALAKLAAELNGDRRTARDGGGGGSGGGGTTTEEKLLHALGPTGSHLAQSATAAATAQQGARASSWSRLCVAQADLALLVGMAHTPAALSATERQCVYRVLGGSVSAGGDPAGAASERGSGDHTTTAAAAAAAATPVLGARTFCTKELVLLHADAGREPRDTRAWLRTRRVSSHHHVRCGVPDDTARVARFICGAAHGLVFSGGGSRGLAHLGVLQAFAQRGVLPLVDVVGGTSQGAFTAAAFACSLSVPATEAQLARLSSSLSSTLKALQSLTLPLHSYFSGTSFNELLKDAFRDRQIEDLWLRSFYVTTDVTAATMRVHTAGSLWRYVRASMTLLGVFPPVRDPANGHLLVDGGYVANLPVQTLRALSPQCATVFAVDVECKSNCCEGIPAYGDSLSGWFLCWRSLLSALRLGDRVRVPSLSELSLRVSYVSNSMLNRELLSRGDPGLVYIQPDVGSKYSILDYHKSREIVDAGREAAHRVLEGWLPTSRLAQLQLEQ